MNIISNSDSNFDIDSRFISLAWNPDNVRRQDYFTVLVLLSDNPVGTQIVWDHIR